MTIIGQTFQKKYWNKKEGSLFSGPQLAASVAEQLEKCGGRHGVLPEPIELAGCLAGAGFHRN